MSFLNDVEVASLAIQQSVFHIVGPGDEHFQLLEAFDAGPYAGFFLDRVRSVHSGNRYEFLPGSAVRAQLARIAKDGTRFQEESEKLATAFNAAHGGSAAVGAFLIFELACQSGRLFALLKFEDEKVLSYDFVKGKSGKSHPTFGAIERTFVQIAARCRRPPSSASVNPPTRYVSLIGKTQCGLLRISSSSFWYAARGPRSS